MFQLHFLIQLYMLLHVWLLPKIGFLIITSRKSHLFTGLQSLTSLWQNSLRPALGLNLDSLTPFWGFRDLGAQFTEKGNHRECRFQRRSGAQGPAVVEPRSPSRGNIVSSTLQGRILLNATKNFGPRPAGLQTLWSSVY